MEIETLSHALFLQESAKQINPFFLKPSNHETHEKDTEKIL
jgi:hypothetical protein